MAIGRQGSLALTVFVSFSYGFGGFELVIHRSGLEWLYQHDSLSHWLIGPFGAFCGFMGATWVHELAHFFAARFVGGYIHKIQIGSGKVLGTFRLMGTACEVHDSLISGLVLWSITSSKRARMKMAFVTASAPLASLFLAGVSIALLIYAWPIDQPSSSIRHYVFPYLAGWTLPCIVFLPGVWLPYRYRYDGRKMESDALRLLRIPWLTDAEIEKRISAARTLLIIRDEMNLSAESIDQALERAEAAPNDELAVSSAAALLSKARDPRALIYYKKLLALPSDSNKRPRVIDEYLTCALEMDAVSRDSAEMDQLSQELLASIPGSISMLGTRGSILVDIGQIDEGKAMLLDVLEKTKSPADKSYANIFLALAEKKRGNLDLARDYAGRSANLDPTCPALKRVSDLLSP